MVGLILYVKLAYPWKGGTCRCCSTFLAESLLMLIFGCHSKLYDGYQFYHRSQLVRPCNKSEPLTQMTRRKGQ